MTVVVTLAVPLAGFAKIIAWPVASSACRLALLVTVANSGFSDSNRHRASRRHAAKIARNGRRCRRARSLAGRCRCNRRAACSESIRNNYLRYRRGPIVCYQDLVSSIRVRGQCVGATNTDRKIRHCRRLRRQGGAAPAGVTAFEGNEGRLSPS